MKALVDDVNHGSQEQANGIEQIGKAIVQMQQVTHQTAASAEESAAAAEELNAQAETLRQSVAELMELIGGKNHAAAIPPPEEPRGRTRLADNRQPTAVVRKGRLPAPARTISRKSPIPAPREQSVEIF